MVQHPKHLVAIGASTGGLNALMEMAQSLQKGYYTASRINLCSRIRPRPNVI